MKYKRIWESGQPANRQINEDIKWKKKKCKLTDAKLNTHTSQCWLFSHNVAYICDCYTKLSIYIVKKLSYQFCVTITMWKKPTPACVYLCIQIIMSHRLCTMYKQLYREFFALDILTSIGTMLLIFINFSSDVSGPFVSHCPQQDNPTFV